MTFYVMQKTGILITKEGVYLVLRNVIIQKEVHSQQHYLSFVFVQPKK